MKRAPSLVYGKNPVREALRAGREVRRILVAPGAREEPRLLEILAIARERGIEVEPAERQRLDDIAHTDSHQGVVAYLHRRQYLELDELLEAAAADAVRGPIIILDAVQDPQNFGSICRTAEAAGAAGVVISRHRSPEVTPAVARASAGAVEHLRIAQTGSIAQALETIKAGGYWVVGLAAEAELDYDQADLRGLTAIVVGSEGEGLHRLVRERCDQLVRLPMLGHVDSLNAAIAASIVVYETLRQRRAVPA